MGVTYIKDSEKLNEFYVLALENDSGTSYCVDVTIDTVVVNDNPNEAMRFNSEDEAKIFFFNRFGFFQHHYGINLVDVIVGKMAIKYELEICRDSYVPYQVKDDREQE